MSIISTESSLVPVRPELQISGSAVLQWLLRAAPEQLKDRSSSECSIQAFSHGQSNPTFLVTSPSLHRPLVLRKKPPGSILKSAHAVEREYRVLAALAKSNSGVPVPTPVALCEDAAVIGTPFYLMEFAKGHIFVDPNMDGMPGQLRRSAYQQMAHTLARLHAADVAQLGLHDFGNSMHYCRRQLHKWTAQYQASVTTPLPEVQQLLAWLQDHVPEEDAQPSRPCICHGDYRLDNLVFSRAGGAGVGPLQLQAVLDWELSTLGSRWSDVAYSCLPYHLPASMQVLRRLGSPQLPEGVPTEQEYLAWYCEAAGCPPPTPADWSFYLALSLFRLLAILAGVQARAKQGNASSSKALLVSSEAVQRSLAQAALLLIHPAPAPLPPTPPHTPSPPSHAQPSSNSSTTINTADSSNTAASSSSSSSRVGGAQLQDVSRAASGRLAELLQRVKAFLTQHVMPAEEALEERSMGPQRWTIHPLMEELKDKAKAAGLWNLWLPGHLAQGLAHLLPLCSSQEEREVLLGAGLTNWEYAHLCELMGRSVWAPEVFNCGAPDTGNMEVLAKYGSRAQQEQWLLPLLQGRIRSCFAMTEKAVASSDATNIQSSIERQGGSYVLSGRKWWTSGALDPRCAVAIFMGKTSTSAAQHLHQSMVLVPMNSPGVTVVRPMLVFGYDDAPHGHAEVLFDQVRVPAANIILGEGRGFEIAQGRLGPGRLHHCMRLVGLAERSIELMATRALQRSMFGRPLARQGAFQSELAQCRVALEGARLLVLHAAAALDQHGNKGARGAIAVAKFAAPNMALKVVDAAIQAHGGAGVSQDTVLARLWTAARTLRIADGPDEVHLGTIAKLELARAAKL